MLTEWAILMERFSPIRQIYRCQFPVFRVFRPFFENKHYRCQIKNKHTKNPNAVFMLHDKWQEKCICGSLYSIKEELKRLRKKMSVLRLSTERTKIINRWTVHSVVLQEIACILVNDVTGYIKRMPIEPIGFSES